MVLSIKCLNVSLTRQATVKLDSAQLAIGGENPAGLCPREKAAICYLSDRPTFKKHRMNPKTSRRGRLKRLCLVSDSGTSLRGLALVLD